MIWSTGGCAWVLCKSCAGLRKWLQHPGAWYLQGPGTSPLWIWMDSCIDFPMGWLELSLSGGPGKGCFGGCSLPRRWSLLKVKWGSMAMCFVPRVPPLRLFQHPGEVSLFLSPTISPRILPCPSQFDPLEITSSLRQTLQDSDPWLSSRVAFPVRASLRLPHRAV